jgi:hypothetical protein
MGLFKKPRPSAYRLFIRKGQHEEVAILGDGSEFGVHVQDKIRETCPGKGCPRCLANERKYGQTRFPVARLDGNGDLEYRTIDLLPQAADEIHRLDGKVDISDKLVRIAVADGPDGKAKTSISVVRTLTADEIEKCGDLSTEDIVKASEVSAGAGDDQDIFH